MKSKANVLPPLRFPLYRPNSQPAADDGGEADGDEIVGRQSVVAGGDAAEVRKTTEHSLVGVVFAIEHGSGTGSSGGMGTPDFDRRDGEPLLFATQAEPRSELNMAVATLNGAGIPRTEVFIGGSLGTIAAAVSAVLAGTAPGRRVAPIGAIDPRQKLGLPALPSREVVIHAKVTDGRAKAALRTPCAAIHATAIGR